MSEKAGRGPDTWMPLYIGDYLADTQHLSAERHGAYLLMLMAAWRMGGALPDDDEQLSSIAKLDPQKWRKAKPVLARFFTIDGGEWRQKRLNAELASAIDTQQKKQAAGKAGASARYGQKPASASSTGIADAWQPQSQTDSQTHTPSPSPSPKYLTPPTPSAGAESPNSPNPDLLGDSDQGQPTSVQRIPHEAITAAYHEILPMCPRIAAWSERRRRALKARWNEARDRQSVEWWREFFAWVAESKFLTGRCPPTPPRTVPFLADIDWLLTEANLLKVIEGKFHREAVPS